MADMFTVKPDLSASPTLHLTDTDAVLHQTISSLMHMTDEVEHILPPDLNLTPVNLISPAIPLPHDSLTPPSFTACSAPNSFAPTSACTSTIPSQQHSTPAYQSYSRPELSTLSISTINSAYHAASVAAGAPVGGPWPLSTPSCSPCAVRELPALNTPRKRKSTRKPKTYSKPVASRFCHICSRMPRKGQGSATCRRMREGYCRKIVCEQCIREQGWDYDAISANPDQWLCPHCAEICPPRSQCHIYNRINARRKRVGQKQNNSVAAACASSDMLLAPYAHLFEQPAVQLIQPPPNFRLNLPPQYSKP
ncbi:hypothetical protein BWQ96_09715 [Gracilariopsis chorda]|uniref:Zinc-finger domain-containing protein n=1 Tax=Gracilariopsis chorda TaxID=448386 RepID=A0A2V3IER0_9FLOR|nr:hypothetical protein BWQ96_09715 [Gracilariopsis chorda]|eukprot:PXF40576.1 hypothetical protein BWQ96_09715 [Gracilariopsis chorda]